MKLQILFLLLFFKVSFLFSQNEYQKSADSLQAIINAETNDPKKIKNYVALCRLYKEYSLTQLGVCNEQLLYTIQKTKSIKDYCFYYENRALICLKNGNNTQATVYAAKANALFYENKDWDNYILNCVEYSRYLIMDDEMEKAAAVLNKALTKAINTKSKHIAMVYYCFCNLYNSLSDYIIALEYAKKAIAIEKNTTNKAKIYFEVAHIYTSLGNFKSALEYNELGINYCNVPPLSNKLQFNKARILFYMERYQEALTIAIACKDYYKKNSNLRPYYSAITLISDCYYKLKKYHLANTYIDEGLNSKSDRRIIKIGFNAKKSIISLALNDTKTSKKYIDEALLLLKDEDYFEQKIEVYSIKSKLEEALGNYKAALYFNNKIATVKDANTANFNKNKLQQLQVELDVTEKNNRIKNLQIAQLKKQVELTTKNNYLIYISIAFVMALLSVFFYVKNYKTIKKKNIIIENEKKLVSKSLLEKETLLKEIHHRVKNNMQLVMSLLSIQAQDETQNITDFMQVSRSRILPMALIHENLYQSESLSNVNFKTYTENLIQIIKNALNTNNSTVDIQIDINEVYLDVQTAIPLGLIINELVSNAYKYAFPEDRNGLIQIKLIQKKPNSELTISDNGVGIEHIENQKKTLGLQLVEELVFQIDGQMNIVNKNGLAYRIRFENTCNK
jgi:two-component system, sensor histidine kinase PdtaS